MDNDLIWKIPEDLKHFKFHTKGNVVIMGRKTYESIGRPLPDRENIIITRNSDYKCDGCIISSSLEEAIMKANKQKETFIIGGSQIYDLALEANIVDKIYLTRIHKNVPFQINESGSEISYFKFKEDNYIEVDRDDRYNEEMDINYSFITLSKEPIH